MSPDDPVYDDDYCAYCSGRLPEPSQDSWSFAGYCDAVCAGFYLIQHAKWTDDHIHASQRKEMMAAFGNIARFIRKQPQGLDRDLALFQTTGELPIGGGR